MPKRRSVPGLSYANVVATLALFVALGGSAYAVKQLPKKSVGTPQLKRGAVTKQKVRKNAIDGRRVKNNSLTGADIKLRKLGTVPSARNAAAAGTANAANVANTANAANVANTASVANSLTPPEGWHEVGTPGEPEFLNSWDNVGHSGETAAFYKDREGSVHLRGAVTDGVSKTVFLLPPGYRPAVGKSASFAVVCIGGPCDPAGYVTVHGPESLPGIAGLGGGVAPPPGAVIADGETALLNGISFRAES